MVLAYIMSEPLMQHHLFCPSLYSLLTPLSRIFHKLFACCHECGLVNLAVLGDEVSEGAILVDIFGDGLIAFVPTHGTDFFANYFSKIMIW